MKKLLILISLFILCTSFNPTPFSVTIARLKYRGGGNWYVSPTALPNLVKFCNENLKTNINPQEKTVEPGSPEIFNYPFVHMTGNGNVEFNEQEAKNLRNYLIGGGFLNINDSYGMYSYVVSQMKKVFPELNFVELPVSHPIYHQKFDFPKGLPKIHEHDGKRPQGFGLIYKGRLVCYFDYESDIGDGWESEFVHHDPEDKRLDALKMGANIIQYVFSN